MKASIFNRMILLAGITLTISCSNDPLVVDNEVSSAVDYAHLQQEFNQIALMFHYGAMMSDGLNQSLEMSGLLSLCSTISVEAQEADIVRMTMDFGESCKCMDGKIRSGKLEGVFQGKWNEPEAKASIKPWGYYIVTGEGDTLEFDFEQNLYKVPGTVRDDYRIQNHVRGARIKADEQIILWEAAQEIAWILGQQTHEIEDDVFHISGSSRGKARNSIPFQVSMLQPLEISLSCPHTLGGVIAFTPETKQTRIVDFGQGRCDREAVVEIAGFTRNISW